MPPRQTGNAMGFTMIELMITLVILVILATAAAPNFTDTMRKNRVESTLRELGGALNLARTEAVSRGKPVVLCRSSDGATCNGAPAVTDGWLIFEDTDKAGDLDAGEPILRIHDNLSTARMAIQDDNNPANTLAQINYDRHGFSNRRMTLAVCDSTQDAKHAHALLVENSGRVALSRYITGTTTRKDINGNTLACP